MANSPIVPTNWWKEGLIAQYLDILQAVGAPTSAVSTENSGAIYVDIDTTQEALEEAGAFVMSESRTKRGWKITCRDGLNWAKTHHPSENPAQPQKERRELTPEERERRERKKALEEEMEQIRLQQQEEAQEDNE